MLIPAYGESLSDVTGLVERLDIESEGRIFEVKTVSNFDVLDHEFNKDEKRLTISINSALEESFAEIVIPKTLLSGNFTFYLNDVEYIPEVQSSDRITFVTLNFTGTGNNVIDIFATETFTVDDSDIPDIDEPMSEGGGCLIATATYGTELAPQVQQLREIRDQKLLKTESGQYFMNHFNNFYYSFSPIVADYERENPLFKESVKLFLTPMISSLSIMNYAQTDSELEVLGVGLGVIALNVSMYFLAPIMIIMRLKK